ncbi:MAG TPA: hypothetical protein PLD95_03700 [bacterium]|jgi:hypothetical protein|nr:hypothetical protein [bacterium]HOG38547.1 hypothetical protein [bacterium]HQI03417.1 hypothetical protein [bacterium]
MEKTDVEKRLSEIYGILINNELREYSNYLRQKESQLIEYVRDKKIHPKNILPVIPVTDTIDKQLELAESNFPQFSLDADLCKKPNKDCPKFKRPSIAQCEYLEYFKDIPKTPQQAYFAVEKNVFCSPATPAYLREKARSSQNNGEDGLMTMFEVFAFMAFGSFNDVFKSQNFESLYILNSYLAENDNHRIILEIINRNGFPAIILHEEEINRKHHYGYTRDGIGTVNMVSTVEIRI